MIRNSDKLNYTWMATGQQFNYTYWKVNNPDFTNNNEYCVEIGWGSDMEWNELSYKYGLICEQNELVGLKHNNAQVLENLQEITKSLNALRQEVQDHDQLKENLSIYIIRREKLQQELSSNQQQQEELKKEFQQEQQVVDEQTDIKEVYNSLE
ncbi:lectin subunit alpha-like [Lucilia sericata]|uniref:lectin subunit alpha-like n=1 Tax=Lucilia sericata TaxID=13632 RepID=UPI0018A85676|nr:lectin subunit alpha-like [Lucilia sericata]